MKAKRLRIALISARASPLALAGGVEAGGQDVYVTHVAGGLADLGHEVDVLTRRDHADLPACVALRPGVKVRHLDAGPPRFVPRALLLPHMPAFTEAVHGLFEAQGPYDVVHANCFLSGLAGLAMRRRFGVPLVTTFHALDLARHGCPGTADGSARERAAIERSLVRHSDRLVAGCPQGEADLQRLYGVRPERIATVPCGVDTEAFRPGDRRKARQRLGLPPDGFIALHLGRLAPRKCIETAVRAMALLPPSMQARLMVLGGESTGPGQGQSPQTVRLHAVAREAGVAERLHLVGRRERHELRDWYVAADVFVTTPWHEPLGMASLEAMACGTPVVGSAVGGLLHTVEDGFTGYLVPPHDPAALADKLHRLWRQPALASAMGRAGVGRSRGLFNWCQTALQLAEVYREAGAPRPSHAAAPSAWRGRPPPGRALGGVRLGALS
jgi:D-inositol-3-phosphate glycosyltransferase